MTLITRQVKGSKLTIEEMDDNLLYLEQLANSSPSYAQTLIVDPNGNDSNGNGSVNSPFQTIQKAHDYSEENIISDKHVVIKINAGDYVENLNITRTKTSFVGLIEGITKSTRLSGVVTINTSSSVSGVANDFVSFENLIIVANSNSSLITISGTFAHSTMFKDSQIVTSSASAKCLDITNSALEGNKIYITNSTFSNKESSATTINFSNISYANIQQLTVFNGTGKAMDITNTDAVIVNSRFESDNGATTMIGVNSSFNVGQPSLTIASSWVVNPNNNGNGIEIASGAIANVGQVAFNVGITSGTGFVVKGVAGSVFISGNNLIVPTSNNKISNSITRISLLTSLTPS